MLPASFYSVARILPIYCLPLQRRPFVTDLANVELLLTLLTSYKVSPDQNCRCLRDVQRIHPGPPLLIDLSTSHTSSEFRATLAVVGAGPAGIVVALEAARHGIDVILLESGLTSFSPKIQGLSDAAIFDSERHAPLSLAVRRQLGGTSSIWGGRCVPYDPIDFLARPIVDGARWPLAYSDIERYFPRACNWLCCGRPIFENLATGTSAPQIVPGFLNGDIRATDVERWSLPTHFGRQYADQLSSTKSLRVLVGTTCTAITCSPGSRRAELLSCRTYSGASLTIKADVFVVAGGGLESTRLLLSSIGPSGHELGNHSGHLGHWYMAHVEGSISTVQFSTDPRRTVYDYERDVDGTYVRRRFSFAPNFQLDKGLPNIVAWLGNPELPDACHGSGPLSFVYLCLRSPLGSFFAPEVQRLSLTGANIPGTPYGLAHVSTVASHLRNIVAHPMATAGFALGFGIKRFAAGPRRAPGFFVYNPQNTYPLQYHGEQVPNRLSRVWLTDQLDVLGRRRLGVDLRFKDQDVDGIIRAHGFLDDYLRALGIGRIVYQFNDLAAAVEARLGGGFHQVGTTRMAAEPRDGVLDRNLAIHGCPNVYVASSSAFPTSGQANSTFMIVAFAIRLADHVVHELRSLTRVTS